MSRIVKLAMVAVFAVILGFSARTSQAAPLPSGTTVSGWTITYNVPGISLAIDPPAGGIQIILEKTAAFTVNTGLLITFTQSGTTGVAPQIQFINEAVTNVTGTNWSGFEFQLLNTIGSASFSGPAGIFVPPVTGPGVNYTSSTFSPTDITYGGSQLNGSTSFWGTTGGVPGGSLIINTSPSTSGAPEVFTFKEIPIVVPLPAAAWQGLGGLLGLGLIGYAKKLKKVLA